MNHSNTNISFNDEHLEKTIVVNSTAAISGGALTILNEFIAAIEKFSADKHFTFIFYTSVDFPDLKNPKIRIINLGRKNYFERIFWDYFGFKSSLKNLKILPDLIMSFQNCGVVYNKSCPQLIYYHNSFCLIPYKWNPFKKNQRILWFYTEIYPFFVQSLIQQKTRIIVQAEWIKKAFSTKFSVPLNRINVILPTVKKSYLDTYSNTSNQMILFFPATSFLYKNHSLLLDMMSYLKMKDDLFYKDVKLIFTLDYSDIVSLGIEGKYKEVQENILLMGYLNNEQMHKVYNDTKILLFPSRIETFGLPLVEAAYKNKFILCSDQAYAHETLEGYKKVEFIDNRDHVAWAERCYTHLKNMDSCSSNESDNFERPDSWFKVIDLIKEMVN